MGTPATLVPDVNHMLVSHVEADYLWSGRGFGKSLGPRSFTVTLQSIGEQDVPTLMDLVGREVVLLVVTEVR
jgi:hypothetical protein